MAETEAKQQEESLLGLQNNAAPQTKYSHFNAIIATCEKLEAIASPEEREKAIASLLEWAKDERRKAIDEIAAVEIGDRPRFQWQSGSLGNVWLDDRVIIIGENKYAAYWRIGGSTFSYPKILPRSTPFYTGEVGEIVEKPFFTPYSDIENLEIKIRQAIAESWSRSTFRKEIESSIIKSLRDANGYFYLDYKDNEGDRVWFVKWNLRWRELPISTDEFLLEVLNKIQDLSLSNQQIWNWLDEIEKGLGATCSFCGLNITLFWAENGDRIEWYLYHKKQKRIPRNKVGLISEAIRNNDVDKILEFLP